MSGTPFPSSECLSTVAFALARFFIDCVIVSDYVLFFSEANGRVVKILGGPIYEWTETSMTDYHRRDETHIIYYSEAVSSAFLTTSSAWLLIIAAIRAARCRLMESARPYAALNRWLCVSQPRRHQRSTGIFYLESRKRRSIPPAAGK